MNEKKWFIGFLCGTGSLLLLIAMLVLFVDPYFHFHGKTPGISYRLGNQRFINNGMQRNFEYDSLLVGTSMTENFRPSEFDELFGGTAIKIPFAGGGFKEVSENLERSFEYKDKIVNVVWALDYAHLMHPWNYSKYAEGDYPTYLYDDNVINDVKYLWNKEVLLKGILPDILYTVLQVPGTSLDDYSNLTAETGKDVVLAGYDRPDLRNRETGLTPEERICVEENIEKNICSVVANHKDTTFYLFFTPYSIVEWDYYKRTNTLLCQIEAQEITIQKLLAYDNVELYSFFDEYNMITDLNNYRDYKHYSQEVNSKILQWIAKGEHRLTVDNYEKHLEEISAFYNSYEYDGMFE